MKYVLSICCIVFLSLVHPGDASARESRFGLGVKAGTLGLGLQARWTPFRYLDLRIGENALTAGVDARYGDIDYDAELELNTVYAQVNLRFPRSPFRITAGVFRNRNQINLVSVDYTDITFGGYTFTREEIGTITGTTTFAKTAPYFGFGFDFGRPGRAGLNFDVGVLWQADPIVTLTSDGTLASDPTYQMILESERQALLSDISAYKAFPVISLTVVYNF